MKATLRSSLTTTGRGGGMVAFPDVCKIPAPPAPFVPVPYPNTQFQENLKAANTADAKALAGDKVAQKQVEFAIRSAVSAAGGDEAGTRGAAVSMNITSATQAVMLGHTLHKKANPPAGVRIAPSQTKVLIGD